LLITQTTNKRQQIDQARACIKQKAEKRASGKITHESEHYGRVWEIIALATCFFCVSPLISSWHIFFAPNRITFDKMVIVGNYFLPVQLAAGANVLGV
jgi:hypothetical protein